MVQRLTNAARVAGRLARANDGNVLPMAAAAVLAIAAVIGAAVDMSRAYRAQSRLQAACDAGVLAGRRNVSTNGYDAAAQATADTFFGANFDTAREQTRSTSFVTTSGDHGITVNAAAATTVPMLLMSIFGKQAVTVHASCAATMGVGNADVTFVLDTTGSMRNTLAGTSTTRMAALQEAMKNFYATIAATTAGTTSRVRYAFVPYSTTVNVGKILHDANPAWLVDRWTVQSRVGTTSRTWWGTTTTWTYKPVTYDVSQYKAGHSMSTATGSGSGGAVQNVASTWAGCIEERKSANLASFAYNAVSGRIEPTTASDLDIDTPPTADDATKWAPLWPEVAFLRSYYYPVTTNGSEGNSWQAWSWCPTRAQLLETMTAGQFDGYVDSLSPDGDTYHDIGMLWGARLSSPQGIFASTVNAAPPNGGNVSRHLIFMTDGEPNADNTIYQAYGIEYFDRRITSNGSTDDDQRHENRFRAICDAVRAKGIRIWVVAFTGTLTSDLTYCASPNSSYVAADASALDHAFQQIAKQVGELRISR